jgi:hypothetical protein
VLHLVRERLLPQDLVAVMAWNRRAHEGTEGRLRVAFSGLAAIYGSKEIPQGLQHDIDAVFDGPGLVVHSTQPSEGQATATTAKPPGTADLRRRPCRPAGQNLNPRDCRSALSAPT